MRLDDERVAALYDDRLAAPERDEVLRQVMSDDFEYDVFAETAAVLRELEAIHGSTAAAEAGDDDAGPRTVVADPPADPPAVTMADDDTARVIPLDSRRTPPPAATGAGDAASTLPDGVIPIDSRRKRPGRAWAYGAVAAGIAAIGLTFAVLNRPAGPLDDPTRAVAMLHDGASRGLAPGWESSWRETRGPGSAYTDQAFAIRIGSLLVDLELAAGSRDTTASVIATRIAALFEKQNIPGSANVTEPYRQITPEAISRGRATELVRQGREDISPFLDPGWLELGMWAETARTAAARGDSEFFRSRTTRDVLDRASKLPGMEERVAASLAAVRDAIRESGEPDWKRLKESISDFLYWAGG